VALPAFRNFTTIVRSCRVGSRVAVTVWTGDPLYDPEVPFEEDTVTVPCRRSWQ
jgi:hypothetical protein